LVIHCRVEQCRVFVSTSPDGNVLFNGTLRQDEVRQYDEPRMDVVVTDASTVDIYLNGRLQKKGPPGARRTYTVVKDE
jgi:hypothetical protein